MPAPEPDSSSSWSGWRTGGVKGKEEEEKEAVEGGDSAVLPGLVVIAGGKASACC